MEQIQHDVAVPPRSRIPSFDNPGSALVLEIEDSVRSLGQLLAAVSTTDDSSIELVKGRLFDVERRLGRERLAVVVVGDRHSGKTTFLNAILGDRLLGTTYGDCANVVVRIRRASEFGYRANLDDGTVQDFRERRFDQIDSIKNVVAEREQALLQLMSDRKRLRRDIAALLAAIDDGEPVAASARAALDEARARATLAKGETADSEVEFARIESAAMEVERALPLYVRQRPPWWMFWQWLLRFLFVFIGSERLDVLKTRRLELTAGGAQLDGLRAAEAGAAGEIDRAEERVAEIQDGLERKKAELWTMQHELSHLRARMSGIRVELARLRSDRARYEEERRRAFFVEIQALTDPERAGRRVVELALEYPSRLLPDEVTLIDTPGVNTDLEDARRRAWAVIEDEADACIVVSDLQRAVGEPTKRFIQAMKEVVPHILLVQTKVDKAFKDAQRRGGVDPWQDVETARRIGTRRFAKEVGRDPASVLSMAVAAESALERFSGLPRGSRASFVDLVGAGGEGEFAGRFEVDMVKLFELLRHERRLMLGARCVRALRTCITTVCNIERRAEETHRMRLAELEARRLPDPMKFHSEQMKTIGHAIGTETTAVIGRLDALLDERIRLLSLQCTDRIHRCRSKSELETVTVELQTMISDELARIDGALQLELADATREAIRRIEAPVFDELRRIYTLVHEIISTPPPALDASLPASHRAIELVAPTKDAFRGFERQRAGIGLGGATAGALVGTLIMPGIGTVVGGMLGTLGILVNRVSSLKQSCVHLVDGIIERAAKDMAHRLHAIGPTLETTMRMATAAAVSDALVRYERWINEPLQLEREVIERQRSQLAGLIGAREDLEKRDVRLDALVRVAAETSVGLCR